MKSTTGSGWIFFALTLVGALAIANEQSSGDRGFRILSWNISNDAFVNEAKEFSSVLRWADPDIVLLDEVSPSADPESLHTALASLRPGDDDSWTVSVGVSGGRQRDIIASRAPQEALPEFSTIVAYPDVDREYILENMSQEERSNPGLTMDNGIPVNGVIILTDGRRLLTVVVDLQCCGSGPESWQEYRRRVEVREIRRLVRKILQRTPVDGVVVAGDLNLVNGATPLMLINGPYPQPHAGLIAAELYHADGANTWTWDGRGMPFPSNTLDFQLYSPHSLEMRAGFILDPEFIAPEVLERHRLERDTVKRTGRHRPLLAEYRWH